MACVNVTDWTVDQVTKWLEGLDNVILQYTNSFLNNGVTGHQLLNLRAVDLENLGVKTLGHQEIILEAVELLKNVHFDLDTENLQKLALRLSCASNSLYKELLLVSDDTTVVQTLIMSDVHNIIKTIKPLISWMERSPFAGVTDYIDIKTQLLQLGFEMAYIAHRDIFSEKPVRTIKKICEKLAKMADHIIQDISDPMILQPAFLDLATLKKKDEEIGFCILPNNYAIHEIADIKYGSPAHISKRIDEGDEIVQVNYHTVIGWQQKKVLVLLKESDPEIVLTLKKRPRHSDYGQIYMKPYRLPTKKRDEKSVSRWEGETLPIHNLSPITFPKLPALIEPPDVEMSSSDSEPPDSPLDPCGRLFTTKPKPILQRRNTVGGTSATCERPCPSMEESWQLWKNQATHSSSCNITNFAKETKFLRDKSVSCNVGLDMSPSRPHTCGLNDFKEKFLNNFKTKLKLDDEKSLSVNSLASLTNETIEFIDEGKELTDRSNMINDDNVPVLKDAVLADVKIHDIIKKFNEKPKVAPRIQKRDKPAVPPRSATTKLRGKLDKSHSTPTYDLNEEQIINESHIVETEPFTETKYELGIPIIEIQTDEDLPPKPPPRTFGLDVSKPAYPSDSPKPAVLVEKLQTRQIFQFPPQLSGSSSDLLDLSRMPKTSTPKGKIDDSSEKISPTNSIVRAMIYSNKNKSKRKNTVIAKRRKVSVSDLQPCDMQGYLFQRLRSKHNQNVHWEKRWFVLLGSCLYGFKNKEDTRAAFLIFLAGFTVAVASEVKSRLNAFKVYHTGTVFYFSTEDPENLQSWLEMITAATLHNTDKSNDTLYSESDEDDDKKPITEKNESLKKFGSLKKFTSKNKNTSDSSSLDRKWFFNKSGTHSKNSLPVPTAQFRSYRKIRNDTSVTTGNFTSHVPLLRSELMKSQNVSVPNLTVDCIKKAKTKPVNYVHSSNPSLYGTSNLIPNLKKPLKNDNLIGFITLEEFMNKQSEERKMNPFNNLITEEINFDLIKPDVVYGEIPIRPKSVDKVSTSSCFGKRLGSLKKSKTEDFNEKTATYPKITKNFDQKLNRSLPRKYYASDRNLDFKERSYEMIYCPETTMNDVQFAQNRNLEEKKLRKQHSFNEKKETKLKSALQYTPMCLPLNQDQKSKPKLAFELNLDEKSSKSSKFNRIFSGKQDSKKEKTFLGSPKLHRAIFRKNNSSDISWPQPLQMSQSEYCLESSQISEPISMNITPHVDYPGLEYPPVFEPETYSLSDPQGSLAFLRKQGKF